MTNDTENTQPSATCLTAPAAGGVAVIRVAGPLALQIVTPFLRGRKTTDSRSWRENELRLCRCVDGEDTIDDAIVAVSRNGRCDVVDINLHGGQRIVQRVLLMLRDAGAQVIDSRTVAADAWPARHAIEREALTALLQAGTKRIAAWLTRMIDALPSEIRRIDSIIRNDPHAAHRELENLMAQARSSQTALRGVRVVLCGEPNTGKSTLANRLAEHERAIVSEIPGTTRDWIEHPTAIDGIPFTIIDTAGIRTTRDAIEREAILRGTAQLYTADIVLLVVDASHAATPLLTPDPPRNAGASSLVVLNKMDRVSHDELADLRVRARPQAVAISALNGSGIEELRNRLITTAGLERWDDTLPSPFTTRQLEALRRCLSALDRPDPEQHLAHAILDVLISGECPQEVRIS